MKMKSIVGSLFLLVFANTLTFGQDNPCNPCGGKTATNPCNPCGKKAAYEPALDPSHAKHGTVFYATDPMGRNNVTFTSEAPLEDITGTTNKIHGYLAFDPQYPRKGLRGHMVVPVADLTTGIPLRDEHMRSADWLNAEAYPTITYFIERTDDIKEIKRSALATTYDMTLIGNFELRGETHEIHVPVRVTFLRESEQTKQKMPGDLLGVRAHFNVPLKDYGITGGAMGQVVGTKLSDTINIEVSLFASSSKPDTDMAANPFNPCNPCAGKKAADPSNPSDK